MELHDAHVVEYDCITEDCWCGAPSPSLEVMKEEYDCLVKQNKYSYSFDKYVEDYL